MVSTERLRSQRAAALVIGIFIAVSCTRQGSTYQHRRSTNCPKPTTSIETSPSAPYNIPADNATEGQVLASQFLPHPQDVCRANAEVYDNPFPAEDIESFDLTKMQICELLAFLWDLSFGPDSDSGYQEIGTVVFVHDGTRRTRVCWYWSSHDDKVYLSVNSRMFAPRKGSRNWGKVDEFVRKYRYVGGQNK
jgi:hypothetical protein